MALRPPPLLPPDDFDRDPSDRRLLCWGGGLLVVALWIAACVWAMRAILTGQWR